MRVLFWGTPDFATAPLRALIGEGFDVCGVVTQPDKPVGRKREIVAPPVKQIALAENIPVFQPATPKDEEFGRMLELMSPDLSVVVAYGHILPKRIIDLPRLGTLNIHASILPALRGAAPIQAAIRQGMTETGISIMRMVPALDAGPVVHVVTTPIAEDETYGELRERLAELGALALVEALALIELGKAEETPQDDTRSTYAPKVTRDTVWIDWTGSARDVASTIRAYDPHPGALTTLLGADVKLFGATVVAETQGLPGTVLSVGDRLVVACGSGAVAVQDVQPSGKRRMPAPEWHRGRGIAIGDCLGDRLGADAQP
jgi:methionyl-tRNA formyltransferase